MYWNSPPILKDSLLCDMILKLSQKEEPSESSTDNVNDGDGAGN